MTRFRRLRSLVGILVAVAIVAPVAVTGTTAAGRHRECKAREHGCGHVPVLSCCCHEDADRTVPTLPASAATDLTAAHVATNAAPVFLALPARGDGLASAALHLHSPPHRGHATDLSVLFSTFLI